jgi:hypothetical protein
MNPVSRKLSQEDQDLVAEYLKNGGAVTVGKYSTGTENPYKKFNKDNTND